MSLTLQMIGTLTCDSSGVEDECFPSAATVVPIQTTPNPKQLGCSTGVMTLLISSVASYVQLPGIGDAGVQQGTFLYVRTSTSMNVRTTTYNALGNVVAVEPVSGFKIVEYDPDFYLTKVEIEGSGTIEYLVAGPE